MGRNIEIDARRGGGAAHEILFGDVTIEATALRQDGTKTVFPAPTTIGISNGTAVLENVDASPAGPEPAWAYRMTFRDHMSGRGWSEMVGVPTGTTAVKYPTLPRFTTTLPPETTKAELQNWVATTEAAKNTAVQAAATATAPTDATMADKIGTKGTLTETALAAAIGERTKDKLAPFFEVLDKGLPQGVVVAIAGDSTGDNPDEWYETTWKEAAAELWPERPAQRKNWNATGPYGPWSVWQTGAQIDPDAILLRDGFDSTTSELTSFPPAAGASIYQGTPTKFRASAGTLYSDGSGSAGTGYLYGMPLARVGTNFRITGQMTMTSGDVAATGSTTMGVWSDGTSVTAARYFVKITGSATAPTVSFGIRPPSGADATLGTFAGSVAGGFADEVLTLELSGLTLSATFRGETLTSTLTQTQVDYINGPIRSVLYTGTSGMSMYYWELTGRIDYPAALPSLDVYNPSVAGSRIESQLASIDNMYPVKPDVLFINHGHNYTGSYTPTQYLASLQGFVDALNTKYSANIPVVVLSQNPRFTPQTEVQIASHTSFMVALRDYADKNGWGYVPGFEAFTARPDRGRPLVKLDDGVHPTQDGGPGSQTGSRLQVATAKAFLRQHSTRGVLA